MNYFILSKDIKNIINNYLLISKIQVNRNRKLLHYNINEFVCKSIYINSPVNKFVDMKKEWVKYLNVWKPHYCLFCDKITEDDDNNILENKVEYIFESTNVNIKYILSGNLIWCEECHSTCRNKINLLNQLKEFMDDKRNIF